MPPSAGSTERRKRASYLAIPPLLSESEPFEGAALLREHPGALGSVLWKSLRDLSAWTETAPADRAALFTPHAAASRADEVASAAAEPELWAPLLVIQRLLAQPDDVDHARLVNACRAIAAWGERRGFGAVQLAFTQAAARLAPAHPELAYRVGRLARDRGEYARAESWLRAAIRLARRTDWHTYALAYLSLGTLYQQLGNLPAARTLTLRGYRTSVRRRVRDLQGVALHNLCVLATESGEYARAQEYAMRALQSYGPGHERLPVLAYDLGCVWLPCGYFDRAIPVFEAALPHMAGLERAMVLANTARAAGGAGDRARFERYWTQATAELATCEEAAMAGEAWLNLARGAVSMRERTRAEESAGRARAIAMKRRMAQLQMEAEAVLDSARAPAPQPCCVETDSGQFREAGELARSFVRALEVTGR